MTDERQGSGGLASVELALTGMHCGSCAGLIEDALSEQEGVAGAVVGLEPPRAAVTYDPALTGPDRLCAAVVATGYGAALLAPSPAVPEGPVD